MGLAAAGSAAGYGLHLLLPGLPWLTASLVLGVIAGCLVPFRRLLDGVLKPGLAVSSRRLLRIGIVVLGLGLSLRDVASLGWVAILLIVGLVLASFAITLGVAKLFRLEGDQPVLLAAGFSICGVSAVGAMSAARNSDEKDAGTPIAMVTLYGTAAILVLPALSALLGFGPMQFGRWVGASVHDVGQVVATAQVMGAAALSVAVVVKLTRVLLLAPMVAVASIATRRAGAAVKNPPIVPLFIVGFVVAVLVRTFIPMPDAVLAIAQLLQSALLAAALFAIGASLRLERLASSGLRALGAGAVSWLLILTLGLGFVYLTVGAS